MLINKDTVTRTHVEHIFRLEPEASVEVIEAQS